MAVTAGRGWLVALTMTIAAGAALRLVQLNVVEFKGDESTVFNLVRLMLHSGQPAQVGMISSLGGFNPPIFLYVLAPVVWLTDNPIFTTGWVALLNVLAIILCAIVVWRYIGPRASYLATLLYALAPWAVVFSRKIWEQEALAPLVLVAFWGLLTLVVEGQVWGTAAAIAALLWMVQLHPSAILLVPVVGIVLLIYWRRLRPLPLAVGLALGILPLLPYIDYGLQHRWSNVAPLLSSANRPAHVDLWSLALSVMNATGYGTLQLEGVPFTQFLQPLSYGSIISALGAALLVASVIASVWCVGSIWLSRKIRNCEGPPGPSSATFGVVTALSLLWVALPVLLTVRHSIQLFQHYFLFSLPMTFVLMGLGFEALCRLGGEKLARLLVAAVSIYAILATVPLVELFSYLRSPANTDFSYLSNSSRVLQVAEQLEPRGTADLILPHDFSVSTVLRALLSTRYTVNESAQDSLVLSPVASQVVVGPVGASPIDQLRTMGIPFHTLTFGSGQVAIGVAVVTNERGATRVPGFRPLNVRLENGVTILGWTGAVDGGTLRLVITWRVDHVVPEAAKANYALYVHVMNGQKMVSQRDAMDYPSSQWQPGRTVLSDYPVPLPASLPPGQYELRMGMYTRPSIQRVPRVGSHGLEDGEFQFGTVTLPSGSVQ
ncbi:MAG: hypothetical protein M1118_03055 [Chloroflexi bacterium]|nr:hypothetical protein [Chloroflexota bacterium]